MVLTKDFKDTVRARMERDPEARKELLRGALECFLAGDVATGKAVLRDYINGTIGFRTLSDRTHTPKNSLTRILVPKGNPRADNLFEVIAQLPRAEGVQLEISLK